MNTLTLRKEYDEEYTPYYTIYINDTYIEGSMTFKLEEAINRYNKFVEREKNYNQVEILKSTDI